VTCEGILVDSRNSRDAAEIDGDGCDDPDDAVFF
jgi:hypothetical protein